MRDAFSQFASQISPTGVLVACGDDREIKKILAAYNKRFITYGFNSNNDYVLTKVNISGDQTFFWVETKGMILGEFAIRVPGEHNALNALSAIILCLELGLPIESI